MNVKLEELAEAFVAHVDREENIVSADKAELARTLVEMLKESDFLNPRIVSSRTHPSWWGNYHQVSNREDEQPLRLVMPHQDPLDVIVSSLAFPHDLANLKLSNSARKGLVIDEETMRDLRLGELAHTINQTRTQAGYRLLEYFLHFPLGGLDEIRKRQEMFRELADNPHIIGSLMPHFEIMAANEAGFVEFTFPQKRSPNPRQDTFLAAKKYLAEISAVVAKLKTARSERLGEVVANLEHILKNGEMQKLYETIVNRETIEIARLDPSTWSGSVSREAIQELQGYTPILAALEHGQITWDFSEGSFRITPRSPSDPVMLNFPLRNLRLDLEVVREKYFDRNLIFNLYYMTGLIEALCSMGSLPGRLHPRKLVFPDFTESPQYVAAVGGAADPYLLLNGVNVVSNDYQINSENRGYLITGPNGGGKTVFGFTLPKLQALAQIGLPVPAEQAQMVIADHIYTIRPTVHEDIGEGRYMHLLRRSKEVIEAVTPKSFVAIDDFEGTDPEDSRVQSLVILEALIRIGAGITMTTQDHSVSVASQSEHDGAYRRIIPMTLKWGETSEGGILFYHKAVPGVGKSIGGVVAKGIGMDRESLALLLEKRGFQDRVER